MSSTIRKSNRIRFPSAKLHSSSGSAGAGSSTSKPRNGAKVTTSRYFEEKVAQVTVKSEVAEGDVKPELPPDDKQLFEVTAVHTRKRKRVSNTVVKTEVIEDEDVKPLLIPSTKKLKTEVDRLPAKYAPPEKYAHLQYLTDYLVEGLDGMCFSMTEKYNAVYIRVYQRYFVVSSQLLIIS